MKRINTPSASAIVLTKTTYVDNTVSGAATAFYRIAWP
jgi:hypothetical protein